MEIIKRRLTRLYEFNSETMTNVKYTQTKVLYVKNDIDVHDFVQKLCF